MIESKIGRLSRKLLEIITQSHVITAVLTNHAKVRDAMIQFES